MAIDPGHAKLPRYRNNEVDAIFRKVSTSKAVGIYLMHRDIWCDAYARHQAVQTDGRITPPIHVCGGAPEPDWAGQKPDHNGKLEGIVHVNPWLLTFGWNVYVDVEARYVYSKAHLDSFNFEVNEVIYKKRRLLNPPSCYKNGRFCMRAPPGDIETYSAQTQALYYKLGGPTASKFMNDEYLTSSGVVVGRGNDSRRKLTDLPQTKATITSGNPDHPYVTFNFPFRFDISSGPDSLYMKSRDSLDINGKPGPRSRRNLLYDSVFGFNHDEYDSDPESPPPSDDEDAIYRPPIRHPGQPIKRRTENPSREMLVRQSEKDLFHPDAYPWQPRQRKAPHNGIAWTVRVYAIDDPASMPLGEHIAVLRFRKLTYLPWLISVQWKAPSCVTTDYCLAIGPKAGADGGVITLVGGLDKRVYAPGEPVEVTVKLHNHSARPVQAICVEMFQCIRSRLWRERVWRSPICRRQLTNNNLSTGMPIMPGSMDCLYRVTLQPWPTPESVDKHQAGLKEYRHTVISDMEDAIAMEMPRDPRREYAVAVPPRHELVPPHHIQRRPMITSSMSCVLETLLRLDSILDTRHPLPTEEEMEPRVKWTGDPHGQCRCFRRKHNPVEISREEHRPEIQPYQIPVGAADVYTPDEEVDWLETSKNELWPACKGCGKRVDPMSRREPIHVSYEVTITAELLDQAKPDPLFTDHLLNTKTTFGSGLLIEPNGKLVGVHGPRITLPCLLAHREPVPENPVPVANYDVDQRHDSPDREVKPPKMWEPSLGKGFYNHKTKPMAPCR